MHFLRHDSAGDRRQDARVILNDDHFIALAPYAPRFPFETWILPRLHSSAFENMPTP